MIRTITNIAKGPRGIWTVTGMKYLDPGETREMDVIDSVMAGLSSDYEVVSVSTRAADIIAAIGGLSDNDFTAAGKPQVDAINTLMPADSAPVTAPERDAVWASMEAG